MERPARWPRWILRYFTLAGINGIAKSPYCGSGINRHRLGGLLLVLGLAAANPALDAELAVKGLGFSKTVIDVGPQGVQGHPPFVVSLDPGQFGAAQTTRATDLDPLHPLHVHGRLDGLL